MFVRRKSKPIVFVIFSIFLLINSNFANILNDQIPSLYYSNITSYIQDVTYISNQTDYVLSKKFQYDDRLGAMNDIVVQDTLAFVAVKWGGLVIFNITDLQNPSIIGSYYEPLNTSSVSDNVLTSGIFVRDDLAFLADGENGLLILNVSSPTNPIKIGHFDEKGDWRHCNEVFVENSYAYIFTSLYLIILDISDPTMPYKISEEQFIGLRNIYVKNDFIFLATSTSCMIINASNPLNLINITTLNDTLNCYIQDEFLFVTEETNNFVIYNLSTLPTLTIIANTTLSIDGLVKYLCANDKYAFVGSTNEIIWIDINEIANPFTISKISNLNWYYDTDSISIKRNFASTNIENRKEILFLIDYQKGFYIYNFSKIPEYTQIGYYDCGMRAELVRMKGQYVYVASRAEMPYYPAQLEIYKYNNNDLQWVSSYITENSIWDLVVADNVVLLAVNDGIEVVDISKPTSPSKIGEYHYYESTYVWNLFYDYERKIIYLCCDINGLIILDASNLQNLTLISEINDIYGYSFRAHDIYVYENIAFVADSQVFGGFGIINVLDPKNPSIIKYIPLNRGIIGIYVHRDLAYLTSNSRILEIFDVTDLTSPIKKGEFDDNKQGDSIGKFSIKDDIYFVARRYSFSLLNISDPTNPTELITINRPFSAFYMDVFVEDFILFIASAWDGLELWELPYIPHLLELFELIFYTVLSLFSISMISIIIIIFRKKRISLRFD
jgi:hypothetical protein